MTRPQSEKAEERTRCRHNRSFLDFVTFSMVPTASLLFLVTPLAESGVTYCSAFSNPFPALSSGGNRATFRPRSILSSSSRSGRHGPNTCKGSCFDLQSARDDYEGSIGDVASDGDGFKKYVAQSDNAYSVSDSTEAGAVPGDDGDSYPVRIRTQGHAATISVRKNEPILQALERFSPELALSTVPHECRRGNCLTCAVQNVSNEDTRDRVRANVDNGLSPGISSALDEVGYVLACCSYVTGPGLELELDQAEQAWDAVYRKRICGEDARQVGMEALARNLRRVDEQNVGKWKTKTESILNKDGI